MKDQIDSYIDSQIKTLQDLKKHTATIEKIGKKLLEAREAGNTIYIMGNGGSASTASHMACDLLKSAIDQGKSRFKVISLTDNTAVFSAWANDTSYDMVFEEQLKNFLTEKDIVIAISGSGNSPNILKAIDFANKTGAYTIGLTGMGGGKLAKTAKLSLIVPNDNMWRVEDIHLLLNHLFVSVFLGDRYQPPVKSK
jgi:D-sedoheptulose 7-phosphate isomerase